MELATQVLSVYFPQYGFPDWVLEPNEWQSHAFGQTKVYYNKEDSLDDVKALTKEREPCNIGMKRLYNQDKMEQIFGWRHGAYERSTTDKLMPNIAVYCYAKIQRPARSIQVHVINLIGYALDIPEQPDYSYFTKHPKDHLIKKYKDMWVKALACAKDLKAQHKIKQLRVFNVGGGCFAGLYGPTFIPRIFEPAFLPLLPEFAKAGIEVLGYDARTKTFDDNVFIPDILYSKDEDVANTLYVNAWDPWSLIGNGNSRDRSLDGYWGRYSNMAVLGWSVTNPQMTFVAV